MPDNAHADSSANLGWIGLEPTDAEKQRRSEHDQERSAKPAVAQEAESDGGLPVVELVEMITVA
jgi:hypothetical protein